MQNKFLIFLDIDGTLIQENQKPNTESLSDLIASLGLKNCLFGLNSNRSLEDIIPVYTQFGLNGPVILENGVYFKKNLEAEPIFLTETQTSIQKDIVRETHTFVREHNLSALVSCTDTVSAIEGGISPTDDITIIINEHRLYTGSIHVYRNGNRDGVLAKQLASHLQSFFNEEGQNFIVESPEAFKNVIIYPSNINKQKALNLIKAYYPDYAFIMIGDDIADAQTHDVVDYFFAVGNALPKVKTLATYSATESYTKGVVEILTYLEKCHLK